MTEIAFPGGHGTPIRGYIQVLRVRKWSILLVAALVIGSAVYFSIRQTPTYESSAQVLLQPVDLGSQSGDFPLNMETEQQLAQSPAVARVATGRLGGNPSIQDLLAGLEVEAEPGTEILTFSYRHSNPEVAQRRAAVFAASYLEYRRGGIEAHLASSIRPLEVRIETLTEDLRDLNDSIVRERNAAQRQTLQTEANAVAAEIAILRQRLADLSLSRQLEVGQVIAPARLPTSPVSPNHQLNVALGAFLGLALGIGLAFLRERLDERLRGSVDLEAHAGAPVLSVVPRVDSWRNADEELLVTVSQPNSEASEAYKTLRVGTLFTLTKGVKTILITSSSAGEGKTATVANLGVALANAGRKVALISADLRNPRLHRFFGVPNTPGLTNVLAGEVSVWDVLHQPAIDNVRLLPSGLVPGNHDALLGSEAMSKLLSELEEHFDVVLIDGTPVLGVADALALAPLSDGVLFVADGDKTSRGAVRRATQQLRQVNAHVIGCVLTKYDRTKSVAYEYEGAYYYPPQQVSPPAVEGDGAHSRARTSPRP